MMKEDAIVGVTSNPTIFQKAISQGNAYDEQLKELVGKETDPTEIFLQLSARDVEAALELLAPVHEQNAQDGFVSMEVIRARLRHPGTIFEARRLDQREVDRPNLYVKIPATEPGLARDRGLRRARQDINITLIFSRAATRERWRRTSAGSSGSSRTAVTRAGLLRRDVLRLAASTPSRQAASTRIGRTRR